MEWKRNYRQGFMHKPHLLYYFYIFFFSFGALFSSTISSKTTCLDDFRCQSSVKADLSFQGIEKRRDHEEENMGSFGGQEEGMKLARRLLTGPGSSPPRCTSKCGNCTPCKPVHVPVPPGTPVTAEYYPEAWRCKCGNKLYMP